ncbi:hypothetical protein AVEN_256130-1 [Araneus ventricosus]|uniref:RNase H type-1 domain-containing protein n=1 Tax=Araneus ventricosus TaxID=182803 RepID=A0A4Y2W6T3_ARAVE|nr:hypothetical protein AVEN_256130-1 [Araneus ventricosus]
MIAIDVALDFVLEHQLFDEIWIPSDSRSVVQYLVNWTDVSDRRGMDIFNKLRTLRNNCVLHLQWIPSHVNLKYNDIVDSLAKRRYYHASGPCKTLTYLEIYSRRKALVNTSWRHPSAHSWYRLTLCVFREGLGEAEQLWPHHPDAKKPFDSLVVIRSSAAHKK